MWWEIISSWSFVSIKKEEIENEDVKEMLARRAAIGNVRNTKPISQLSTWKPLQVRSLNDLEWKDNYPNPEANSHNPIPSQAQIEASPEYFAAFAGPILWSSRAKAIYDVFLAGLVEFLPVNFEGEPYWFCHVLNTVECLDREQSDINYFRQTGNVNRVRKYVFKSGCLDGQRIFKMPEHNYSSIIVSDEFKQIYEAHQMTGLKFEPKFEG